MALTDKLTAIANALRSKTGGTGKLTLEQIASGISGLTIGEATAPANAPYWYVGTWKVGETLAAETRTRMYFGKKMASGVSLMNNTTLSLKCIAVSCNSSGKVTALSTAKTVAKNGSTTFTDSSAHHLYIMAYTEISIMGKTQELILNASNLFGVAKGVTITGTEVS